MNGEYERMLAMMSRAGITTTRDTERDTWITVWLKNDAGRKALCTFWFDTHGRLRSVQPPVDP